MFCLLSLISTLNFIFLFPFLDIFLLLFALFINPGTIILEWFSLTDIAEEGPTPIFLFITFICLNLKFSFLSGLLDCCSFSNLITSSYEICCSFCLTGDISEDLSWPEGACFKWDTWFKVICAPLYVWGNLIFLFLLLTWMLWLIFFLRL